ncbi:hypothetical protein H0A36_08320 [Endozoicomonas sp. SM1973]|uniref:Uncharacterized protein n=1 Tax=Spartinivicinus marinus TaxID=2994442 RepID=A0A853I8Y1_9GAMM|nr:hypothetical protein [Spartinivicinus marinus]MCX4025295.1 hypothetical protein [Spartinivicinus marinus]NYZ66017.1 hypothetical protein [Spartinivicinus marinus]
MTYPIGCNPDTHDVGSRADNFSVEHAAPLAGHGNVVRLSESIAAQQLFNHQQLDYQPQTMAKPVTSSELIASSRAVHQLVNNTLEGNSLEDNGVVIDDDERQLIKNYLERSLSKYILSYGKWEIKAKLRRLPKDPVSYFSKTGNEQRPVNGKWASPKHLSVFNKIQTQIKEQMPSAGVLEIEDGRVCIKEPFPQTAQSLANYLNILVGNGAIAEEQAHNSNKSTLIQSLLEPNDQKIADIFTKYIDVLGSEKNRTTRAYRVLFKTHDNPFEPINEIKQHRGKYRIRANTTRAAEVIEHDKKLLSQLFERLEACQKQVVMLSRGGLFEQSIQQIATKADNHFSNHVIDYKTRKFDNLKVDLNKCQELLKQPHTHLATKDGIEQLREQLKHYQSYVIQLELFVAAVDDLTPKLSGYKAVSDVGEAIQLVERLENHRVSWNDYMPTDTSQSGKVKLFFQKVRARWWAFVARSSDWDQTIHYNRKNDIIASIKIMHEQADKLNQLLADEGKQLQLDNNALLFRVELADRLLKIFNKLKNKSAIRFGFIMLKRKSLEKLLANQLGLAEGSVRNFTTHPSKKSVTGVFNRLTERLSSVFNNV